MSDRADIRLDGADTASAIAARPAYWLCSAALATGLWCGCDSAKARLPVAQETRQALAPAIEAPPPYTMGRWRLVSPTNLENVMLWVSHVLIRHEDVAGTQVCFGPPGWHAFPPPPHRSRGEALSLATELAEMIHAAPQNFAKLAREHSEDPITRDTGGSLGGIIASELLRTPEILDALAAMQPGEVSRVIETHCGFHVLHRRPIPPDTTVSGSRIVIGHDGARWLHRFGARRSIPSRSRSQALILANEVYDRARANPAQFSELVREYSEHRDALYDGDLGEWSTHERSAIPREIEVLHGLADGDIAAPIEGLFGFAILRRTHNRPRQGFAMEALHVYFDAEAPEGDPMSKHTAWNTTSEAVKTLANDPARWAQLHSTHGSDGIETWSQGRAPRELELLLEGLGPGDVADRAVEWNSSFVIARGVTPMSVPVTHHRQYELPEPVEPDISYLAHRMPAGAMRRVLLATINELAAAQKLSTEQMSAIEGLAPTGQSSEAASAADPSSPTFAQLKQELGVELFGEFQKTFARHLESEAFSVAKILRLRPS